MSTSAKTSPRALALPGQLLAEIYVRIRLEVSIARAAMVTDFRVTQYAQV